jgi:hypothetical protein
VAQVEPPKVIDELVADQVVKEYPAFAVTEIWTSIPCRCMVTVVLVDGVVIPAPAGVTAKLTG